MGTVVGPIFQTELSAQKAAPSSDNDWRCRIFKKGVRMYSGDRDQFEGAIEVKSEFRGIYSIIEDHLLNTLR